MMKTSKRTRDEGRHAARDALVHSVSEVSLYDCVDIIGSTNYTLVDPRSFRLFGNANVGSIDLTNLQIPGQLPGDQALLVGGWRVRMDMPDGPVRDAWNRVAPHVHATFNVGSHPCLHGMFDEMNTLPTAARRIWPVFVPPRQNFDVRVDFFEGGGGSLDRLREVCAAAGQASLREPEGLRRTVRIRAWVHLDGILIRPSEVGGMSVPDSLIERVHRHMIHVETETRSVEQRIVDWIGAQAPQGDDASQAQLAAICDGILEQRWNR